jgi:hypothetical protein
VRVTGYWPFDGSDGIAFLKQLIAGKPKPVEKKLRTALQEYLERAEAIAAGGCELELEPENFAVLAQDGGVDAAKREYHIREEAGKYWMRSAADGVDNRAFIACAVLFCACNRRVMGEIYNDCESAVADCAEKLSLDQVEGMLPLARQAAAALRELGELSESMRRSDQEMMAGELDKFLEQFDKGLE